MFRKKGSSVFIKFLIFEVLSDVSMKIPSAKLRRVFWYLQTFRWNPLNRCSRIRAAFFSAESGVRQIRGFTFRESGPSTGIPTMFMQRKAINCPFTHDLLVIKAEGGKRMFTFSLILQSPEVALCNSSFYIQKLYLLPKQRIYVFCTDLRTNRVYFPIQHYSCLVFRRFRKIAKSDY